MSEAIQSEPGDTEPAPELGIGGRPIPGASPVGEDANGSETFDDLRALIGVMGREGPDSVDWNQIVSSAETILTTQSKHLATAAILVRGRFHRDGFAGLRDALIILDEMIRTFWDDLYPRKKTLRSRVSEGLFTALGPYLEQAKLPADFEDARAVKEANDAFGQVFSALNERLGVGSFDAKPTRSPLSKLAAQFDTLAAKQAPKPPPPPQPPAPSPSADANPQPGPDQGSVPTAPDASTASSPAQGDDSQAQQTVAPQASEAKSTGATPGPAPVASFTADAKDNKSSVTAAIRTSLTNAATFLRKAAPTDPASYLMVRMALNTVVEMAPPIEGTNTTIPAPPQDTRQEMAAMEKAGNYQGVVDRCEFAVIDRPFWLDPHYSAHCALEALGPSYDPARAALREGVSLLVRRIPALMELTFADGSPFANDETRTWLKTLTASEGDGGEAPKPWEDALQAARAANGEGRLSEALSGLRDGARAAPSGAERFRWTITAARFCLDVKRPELALPMLERLQAIGNAQNLAEWDPPLLADVGRLLAIALSQSKEKGLLLEEEHLTRLSTLREDMAMVDLAAAAALTP